MEILSRYAPTPFIEENYTLRCGFHTVHTIVTATPHIVRDWVAYMRHRHRPHCNLGRMVVGLGVHWSPDRPNVAATLQLCVGNKCLIFQLAHAYYSPGLLHLFLTDPDVIFVGFWNYREADLLANSWHNLQVARLVDLRNVASDLRGCRRNSSVQTLAAEILGMHGMVQRLEKRSRWDAAWLSEDQVKYASLDVFLAFLVGMDLPVWDWVYGHY